MNSNKLLPLNSMFKCDKNKFVIPIFNMGDRNTILQSKRRIGNVYPQLKNVFKGRNHSIN